MRFKYCVVWCGTLKKKSKRHLVLMGHQYIKIVKKLQTWFSVLYNDDLICTQTTGQCKSEGNNLISTFESDNDFICYLKCLSTENCYFYTWYTSGDNSDKCFFYSSCDTINECNNGECVIGSIDLYVLNPTTPSTTNPTTTSSSATSLVPSLTFLVSLLIKILFFWLEQ